MAGLKVPVYDRQVQPAQAPSVGINISAGAADFGGIEAEAIGRIGGQVQQLGEQAIAFKEREQQRKAKYQDDLDKLYASDALIKYKDNIRGTRENFFARRGINSVGVADEANKYLNDLYREISKDMTPNQKRYFDVSIQAPRDLLLNQVTSHQASEFQKTKIANSEARITLAKDEAANIPGSYNEDLALENAKNDIEFGADSIIKDLGLTGAEAKAYKADHLSEFHLNYLNSQAVVNIDKAKEYYNNNKKDIAPEKREAMEKLLNDKSILYNAQQISDNIERTEPDNAKWNNIVKTYKYKGTEKEQAETRKMVKDIMDAKKRDYDASITQERAKANAEIDDKIVKGFFNGESEATLRSYALNAPEGDIDDHMRTVDYYIKKRDGKEIISDDILKTKEYNDFLDGVLKNIDLGAFKSIGDLKFRTLGRLSESDQKFVESHFTKGGALGSLNVSELHSAFQKYSGLKPAEDDDYGFLFHFSRNYIQHKIEELPAGTQKIPEGMLDAWMQQSVVREVKENLFTKKRGLTVAARVEAGQPVKEEDIDISDKEIELIDQQIDTGNATRAKFGLPPYPKTKEVRLQVYKNTFGLNLEAPKIEVPITRVTGGLVIQPTVPAPPPTEVRPEEKPVTKREEPKMMLSDITPEKFTEFSDENIDKIYNILKKKGVDNRDLAKDLLANEILKLKEEQKKGVQKPSEEELRKVFETIKGKK